MRIKTILLSMLAGLAFVGCTSRDDVDPNGGGSGDGSTRYLAVNLVSSDLTRAGDGYEDGSQEENKVTSVRFYFFNAAGGAASVKLKNGKYVNFYDWETPTQKPDGVEDDNDIESLLSATIIINTGKEDRIPAMVAAVLNPTIKDDNSRSLTDLKDLVADYATGNLTKEGSFVMFNSVYRNGGAEISATSIKPENLQDTEAKALANPVKIYVERNVAKVGVELAAGFVNGKLALKTKDGEGQEIPLLVDGKQVYLEILGWDLAAETSHGRLVKRIDPGWTNNNLFGGYRSYWAINSMKDDIHNVYDKSYDQIRTAFDKTLYTNENADKEDIEANIKCKATKDTKVILAGKLMDSEGNALNIVRHVGAHFIDDASYKQLRTNILNQLSIYRKYYYDTQVQVEDGEGNTVTRTQRKQIDIDDIQIVNPETQEKEDSKNNCYVYAQLTDAAAARTWYTSLDQDAQPLADAAKTINADLANKDIVSWPLVWNNGMTYYFYEINHLEGYTGVVRNHVYKTRVTKILGLGTPVYNPGDIIYPEKPDPKQNFIAAEVQILSWRIISNDNVLEW